MNRFLMTIMTANGLYELDANGNRLQTPVQDWVWGNFGKRVGSRRSADGMIYSLPSAPMNQTGNNKVVAKLIFSSDNSPAEEIKITNLLSKDRVGPKLFKCYSGNITRNLLIRNIGQNKLIVRNGPLVGSSFINLFQQFVHYPLASFSKVFIIIMENLYDNPAHGVVGGFTLGDILDKKPGTGNMKIPVQSLRNKYLKMHNLGVVHGDMHPGNIIIQKLERGRFGARIIDFGRSIYRPGVHFTNLSARQAAVNQEAINGLPRHKNNNMFEFVRQFAGSAEDTKKLTSGIVSILKSAARRHNISARKAHALQVQLVNAITPQIANFERQRNNARMNEACAIRRGSLGKYSKGARAKVLGSVVKTLQRRKESNARRIASGQCKYNATKQRRLAAVRPPTVTGVARAQLSFARRQASIFKGVQRSLQRRLGSKLARAPHYNAILAQKRSSAQRHKAASVARRANQAAPMNWEETINHMNIN
jgi:tRNA A-37 threonylcarbamoyl transferase component Bud32